MPLLARNCAEVLCVERLTVAAGIEADLQPAMFRRFDISGIARGYYGGCAFGAGKPSLPALSEVMLNEAVGLVSVPGTVKFRHPVVADFNLLLA